MSTRMPAELDKDRLGAERVQEIAWSHPSLSGLSDAARIIYACLVDGCTDEARETIVGIGTVWRDRESYSTGRFGTPERREAVLRICHAVEELLAAGLLLLLDDRDIAGGWVRKPWQGAPS
jgi:hypothetical protein